MVGLSVVFFLYMGDLGSYAHEFFNYLYQEVGRGGGRGLNMILLVGDLAEFILV